MEVGTLLLLVGAVLAASILVGLGASRAGVPALVAFSRSGCCSVPTAPGDRVRRCRAGGDGRLRLLVAILYEGGLRPRGGGCASRRSRRHCSSTIGVAVTAFLTGFAAHELFDLDWPESILSAASSLDRRGSRLRDDALHAHPPQARTHSRGPTGSTTDGDRAHDRVDRADRRSDVQGRRPSVPDGQAARDRPDHRRPLGFVATKVFANLPASVGSFAPFASVSVAALSYGVADVLGGSGFLAVYLVGLRSAALPRSIAGSRRVPRGAAFLAQVTMFVVLGLLVFPSDLPRVMVSGFVLALFLVVVIRPLAVWASTAFSDFSARERTSSASPGCAAPSRSCSDIRPLGAHRPRGDDLQRRLLRRPRLCAVQGTTLEWVASRLRLVDAPPPVVAKPLTVDEACPLDPIEFEVAGRRDRGLGRPRARAPRSASSP